MIRSFAEHDTERLFQRESVRRFPTGLQRTMLRRLVALDAADTMGDLRSTPGHHVVKLRGTRVRHHGVRITDCWCVCFRWRDGDAHNVEIVKNEQER